MINLHDNYWVPSEGYKYITNDIIYSNGIYLGTRDNINNWHDTNNEPLILEEISNDEALSILLGGDT